MALRIVLLVLGIALCSSAKADGPVAQRVCNKTSKTIFVQLGWHDGTWAWLTGNWKLGPGACSVLTPDTKPVSDVRFIRAFADDGETWPDEATAGQKLCTPLNDGKPARLENVCGAGSKLVRVFHFSTSDTADYNFFDKATSIALVSRVAAPAREASAVVVCSIPEARRKKLKVHADLSPCDEGRGPAKCFTQTLCEEVEGAPPPLPVADGSPTSLKPPPTHAAGPQPVVDAKPTWRVEQPGSAIFIYGNNPGNASKSCTVTFTWTFHGDTLPNRTAAGTVTLQPRQETLMIQISGAYVAARITTGPSFACS